MSNNEEFENLDGFAAENLSFLDKPTDSIAKVPRIDKLKKYIELLKLARKACELAPLIRLISHGLSYQSNYGIVSLILPVPMVVCSTEGRETLSALFSTADNVFIANTDKGILMSFVSANVFDTQ